MWKAKKVISIITICIFVLGALAGCNKKAEPVAKVPRKVKVQEAKIEPLETYVEYPGVVKPFQSVEVSSQSPGKIEAMYFEVGQEVKKGQPLYQINTDSINAQYNQSQASLESAKVNYNRTADSSIQQQLSLLRTAWEQAELQYNDAKKRYEDLMDNVNDPNHITPEESAFDQAQLQFNDAQKNYNDVEKQYKSEIATKQQLEAAEYKLNLAASSLNGAKVNLAKARESASTQLQSAKTQYEKAKSDLNLQEQKLGPQSIDVAAAQVSQARSSVDAVRVQLEDARATSPIDGVVSAKNIEVGEILNASKAAYTIINTKQMKVETDIPDKMFQTLSTGQKIRIKVNTDKEIEGTIGSLSPSTGENSRSYKVEIIVDNTDKSLTSGMFARVMFVAEKKDNVLLVPSEAIKIENEIAYVYTVADNKVKKKSITVGLSNDKVTEITANLQKGEIVVIEGQAFLNEGDSVETSF